MKQKQKASTNVVAAAVRIEQWQFLLEMDKMCLFKRRSKSICKTFPDRPNWLWQEMNSEHPHCPVASRDVSKNQQHTKTLETFHAILELVAFKLDWCTTIHWVTWTPSPFPCFLQHQTSHLWSLLIALFIYIFTLFYLLCSFAFCFFYFVFVESKSSQFILHVKSKIAYLWSRAFEEQTNKLHRRGQKLQPGLDSKCNGGRTKNLEK